MKAICISDTHNLHKNVILPEGDIVLCAGDITNHGDLVDVASFSKWVTSFGHSKVVTIAGNHDFCFQDQSRILAKNILEESGIVYLEDSEVVIDGIKIYGSPWQPWFGGWAFNLNRGPELQRIWSKIPDDTGVLITHGPPYAILDFAEYGQEHVGCEDLRERVKQLKNLKIHLFGHIHEHPGIEFRDRVQYVNASICTLQYKPTNSPIVLEI